MHANVLLLQGPIGPFFRHFAEELTERGFNVWKINLNGGDKYFYGHEQAMDYSGNLKDWETYLTRVLVNKEIGRIYLYGDCRAYHRVARKLAKRHGGHSPMLGREFTPNDASEESENSENTTVHSIPAEHSLPKVTLFRSGVCTLAYYFNSQIQQKRFPEYQHHRTLKLGAELARWARGGLRKVRYKLAEKDMLRQIINEFEGNYFVCPLQVHCDMQVVVHSNFNSIEHFIGDVLTSFAKHAAPNKAIVFKHHPMDRAYKDYSHLFENLVAELGLHGRVFYVHDVCLPTLLKNAEGSVLINSTVGMSSLFHGTPVKTLGKAIYDIPGLTVQRSLKSFWGRPGSVDKKLFVAFRQHLIKNNQLNGSFSARLKTSSTIGLRWSETLSDQHRYIADQVLPVEQPVLRVVGGLDVERVDEVLEDKKAA